MLPAQGYCVHLAGFGVEGEGRKVFPVQVADGPTLVKMAIGIKLCHQRIQRGLTADAIYC